MSLTLILGGARSGKSHLAEQMARERGGPVLFVATAQDLDEEMKIRIEAHRQARPREWRTLEASLDVGRHIREVVAGEQTVILDCVTLLVNNVIMKHGANGEDISSTKEINQTLAVEVEDLAACFASENITGIVVSNEVGLGLVPDNPLGRLYRDMLGCANRLLAQRADEVFYIVAGLPLRIKPAP